VKIVVDMNLSPIWVGFLTDEGFDAVHWSQIGDPRAEDRTIMQWARSNDHVVFTHDLGFSALLAAGGQDSPSVVQVRSQDVMPDAIGADVIGVLRQHADQLHAGAIITIDEMTSRLRILPIQRKSTPSN
jgi:predicted nuclease of predicted toxin-antitoxin system